MITDEPDAKCGAQPAAGQGQPEPTVWIKQAQASRGSEPETDRPAQQETDPPAVPETVAATNLKAIRLPVPRLASGPPSTVLLSA